MSAHSKVPFRYVDRVTAYAGACTEADVKQAIAGSVYRDVPLSALAATQRRVSTERLLQYLADPKTKPKHGGPVAVVHGGQVYVHNGHHRATAARARGDDTMRMHVANLDGPRRFGEHHGAGTIAMIAPQAMAATYQPCPEPCVRIDNGIAILSITGPLEAKPGNAWFSFFDDYETITHRFREALEHPDVHGVLLQIDSPGGLAAGLNAACDEMRRLKAKSGKLVWAYADEKACSAAYALACVADAIYLPRAAEIGSIGVTATLLDMTEADKKAGLRYAVITSGKRKADGDPHTVLSANAIAHMQRRVDQLAAIYYALVADARGMPVKKIQSLQADTYTGQEAVTVGLADGVQSLRRTLRSMRATLDIDEAPPAVAQIGTDATGADMAKMTTAANAAQAVRAAAKSVRAAKGSARTKALAALARAEAALARAEKYEDEKTPPADEAEEDPPPASSDASEEEADPPPPASSDASSDASEEEEEDAPPPASSDASEEEDEEEQETRKALDALASVTTKSKTARRALAQLSAAVLSGQRASKMVAKIQSERRAEKKALAIEGALVARKITRHEAKDLRGKPSAFVRDFLSMRKRPLVATEEDALRVPSHGTAGAELPAPVMQAINEAVASSGQTDPAAQAKLREALIAAQRERRAHNGGMH